MQEGSPREEEVAAPVVVKVSVPELCEAIPPEEPDAALVKAEVLMPKPFGATPGAGATPLCAAVRAIEAELDEEALDTV